MLELNLNNALNILETWCLLNGMQLNTEKTKVIFLTTNQRKRHLVNANIELVYKSIILKQSSCEKLLGVFIQDDLKWDSHVKSMCKKVSSYIWLLSRINDCVSLKYRILFYKAYIQPHIDYCLTIWGSTSSNNIKKIISLQKRACRTILGPDYIDFEHALNILKIFRFDQRLFYQRACFMFKIGSILYPSYVCDMFQQKSLRNEISVTLRSNTNLNFQIPKTHTQLFKNSLLYAGPIVWNCLPTCVKLSHSFNEFKRNCIRWMANNAN